MFIRRLLIRRLLIRRLFIRRVLVHQPLICRSLILPAARERGLKEKWREAKNPTNIRKRYFRK